MAATLKYAEKNLCTEIVNSMKNIGAWAYKIPDMSPHWRGQEQFSPARAFDIISCWKGIPIAIEAKYTKGLKGFSRSRITEFELTSLVAFQKAGGKALLAFSWGYNSDNGGGIIELFLMNVVDWVHIEWSKSNTIPRDLIIENSVEVSWLGKGIWDLREIAKI